METINLIIDLLKQNFNFLIERGYACKPIQFYNQNDSETFFAMLIFKNNTINRELVFTIYPRAISEIEILIVDRNVETSMNIKHYIDFKKGNPPRYVPDFIVDQNNIKKSVDEISTTVRSLIEGDLKDVVFRKEWITFPTYDPRDDY